MYLKFKLEGGENELIKRFVGHLNRECASSVGQGFILLPRDSFIIYARMSDCWTPAIRMKYHLRRICMWNLYRGIVLSCMVMYVRTN